MGEKISFSELTSSEAYQRQGASWSKAHITVAISVAAIMGLFGSYSLGLHWVWVIPVLFFGSSVLIGMPTMMIYCWIVTLQSKHMSFEPVARPVAVDSAGRILGMLKNAWSVVSLVLTGSASYFLVRWIGM